MKIGVLVGVNTGVLTGYEEEICEVKGYIELTDDSVAVAVDVPGEVNKEELNEEDSNELDWLFTIEEVVVVVKSGVLSEEELGEGTTVKLEV